MYLSDKKNGVNRATHDHEELEVLLESFSKQFEEIVNESENIEVNPGTKHRAGTLTALRHRPTFNQRRKL